MKHGGKPRAAEALAGHGDPWAAEKMPTALQARSLPRGGGVSLARSEAGPTRLGQSRPAFRAGRFPFVPGAVGLGGRHGAQPVSPPRKLKKGADA